MNRLVVLNRYTSTEIYELTGEEIEHPIVVVGNVLERRKVENCIADFTPISIVGPPGSGKLTAIIEICDRLDYRFHISYDGKLPPMYDDEAVYIIRNPTKLPRGDYRIVALIDEGKSATKEAVRFRPPTSRDKEKYLKLKGVEMITNSNTLPPIEANRQLVALSLLEGVEPHLLPNDAHRWIARNLYMSSAILKLCDLAQQINDKDIYWALINLVRIPRPMGLQYPKWVKMK